MFFDLDGKCCKAPAIDHLEEDENEPLPPETIINIDAIATRASLKEKSSDHLPPLKQKSSDHFPQRTESGTGGVSSLSNGNCFSLTDSIRGHLANAKEQARLRQQRLRIPAITCGVILLSSGMSAGLSFPRLQVSAIPVIASLLVGVGFYMLLLSLIPIDKHAIPCACTFVYIPFLAIWILYAIGAVRQMIGMMPHNCTIDNESIPCGWLTVNISYFVSTGVLGLAQIVSIAFFLIRKSPTPILLRKLWSGTGLQLLSVGVWMNLTGSAYCMAGHIDNGLMLFGMGICLSVFGALMLFGTSTRKQAQSWFMSRGETAIAAAGLAELIGGWQVADVLSRARESFCCVPADQVNEDHMIDNKPNPELASFTQKGHLGLVDAFVSHSWHDDCTKKWRVLQEFREKHKREHQNEPLLWIDKYCIDQTNIDESLACLPVYLAGCRKLLVLCGETYLQRLWCLIEIFTFLQMGGLVENLEVRLLEEDESKSIASTPSTNSSHSLMSIRKMLQGFDPRAARCSSDYDTERLHAVMEAFGYGEISDLVHNVFLGQSIRT